jgi:hypothetical protein
VFLKGRTWGGLGNLGGEAGNFSELHVNKMGRINTTFFPRNLYLYLASPSFVPPFPSTALP